MDSTIPLRIKSWESLPNREDQWLHLNSLFHKDGLKHFNENYFKIIPPTVKKLFMSHNSLDGIKNIPSSVTHLHLGHCFFSFDRKYEFPPNLEFISLRNAEIMYWDIINLLKALPQNLHTLILCDTHFQDDWVCFLPKNLKILNVRGTMIQKYPFVSYDTKVLYEETPYEFSIKKAKENIKKIKEDLMIKTWETKRMFDWCLDIEDQEYLLSCG